MSNNDLFDGDNDGQETFSEKYFHGVPTILPASLILVTLGVLTAAFIGGGQPIAVLLIAVGVAAFLVGRGIYYGLQGWLGALVAILCVAVSVMLAMSPPSFVTDAMSVYVPIAGFVIVGLAAVYAAFFAGEEDGYY